MVWIWYRDRFFNSKATLSVYKLISYIYIERERERGFLIASHLSSSTNHNVTFNITCKVYVRQRERQRQTERNRERDRDWEETERQRQRGRARDRQRQRQTDREQERVRDKVGREGYLHKWMILLTVNPIKEKQTKIKHATATTKNSASKSSRHVVLTS